MQHLERSFNAFFKGEARVAVIKGNWGVGKTYFWNNYIDKKISDKDLTQIAYSYISLFGKASLSDVKKSLFHSAKPISSGAEIEIAFNDQFARSSSLLNRVPWIKDGIKKTLAKAFGCGWLINNIQNIPVIGKFSNLISIFEYSLVNNYVICFDDLERKGDALAVKEIMGLIDELAIRKNCKIILIFNESSLDKDTDKKEFDLYREKVVDIELSYEPTCVENMKHAFPNDFKQLSIISDAVNELDIKNIRVLKKIFWMIDDFSNYLDGVPDSLRAEFLTHAILLCWGYFIRDKELSFETIKSHLKEKSWMSFISDKDKKRDLYEKEYSEIASNLKLSSSNFDPHIIHYLEHGFVNEETLKITISNLLKLTEVEQVRVKLRKAWSIYTDSFKDNRQEFIDALKEILEKDIAKLGLSEFSSTIDILEEFGECVSGYIESYKELHKESLKVINPRDSWDMERIKNHDLRAMISEIHEENKNFNIDDVTEQIAENWGWDSEDIDFLSSRNKEDFHAWMKGNPEKLTKKIRSGLLMFRKLETSNQADKEKFIKIASNVKDALRDIANENDFNRKRIKNIYGVELEM